MAASSGSLVNKGRRLVSPAWHEAAAGGGVRCGVGGLTREGKGRRRFYHHPRNTGAGRGNRPRQASCSGSGSQGGQRWTGTQALDGRGDPSSSEGLRALPPWPEPGELAEV